MTAPEFAFTPENTRTVETIIAKYPTGRQASAVLPLLDLAQRQNGGWLSIPALEVVADCLGIPLIRVMEVATFYTMFNLKPVGKFHLQVCGTTPCWLRGAEQIMSTIQDHLGIGVGDVTKDGLFSVCEVECLGACVNAPVVQINDDFYEDLSPQTMIAILEAFKRGEKVPMGSQIGRHASEPVIGSIVLTTPAALEATAPTSKPRKKKEPSTDA